MNHKHYTEMHTMYDSVVTMFPCQPFLYKISVDHYFLKASTILFKTTSVISHKFFLPTNSLNPPTGSRHVPVTNCNRRHRLSLSNSLTAWSIKICFKSMLHNSWSYQPEPLHLLRVTSIITIYGVGFPFFNI